jgi:flagellin-specific chaperone FliS
MSEQHLASEDNEELLVEVHYNAQRNQVIITANDHSLSYLEGLLRALREKKFSGHHYHIDRATNIIEGNVDDLVLQRK